MDVFVSSCSTGNCIRRWLDNHWYDFENNEELVTVLLEWIRGPLSRSKFGTLPTTLENVIKKKVRKGKKQLYILHSDMSVD